MGPSFLVVVNTKLLKFLYFIFGLQIGIETTEEPVSFDPAENGEFC